MIPSPSVDWSFPITEGMLKHFLTQPERSVLKSSPPYLFFLLLVGAMWWRFSGLEDRIQKMEKDLSTVSKDVAYIKGYIDGSQ